MPERRMVNTSAGELRAMGRRALAGKWGSAVITAMIYLALIQVPQILIEYLFKGYAGSNASYVYSLLVMGPFSYGFAMYCIRLFREGSERREMLFSGFERFLKTLSLYLLIFIFTFLWSLLFLIPGILAGLSYSQAFKIMADHPEYSALECIRRSKFMMYGNRLALFALNLSFIGWILLAAVLPTIVGFVLILRNEGVADMRFVSDCTLLVSVFTVAPVSAYSSVTDVAFYDILCGRLRAGNAAEGADIPSEPIDIKIVDAEYVEAEEVGTEAAETKDAEAKEGSDAERVSVEAKEGGETEAGKEEGVNSQKEAEESDEKTQSQLR